MNVWLIVFILVGVLIVLGLLGFLVFLWNKNEELKEDNNFCINLADLEHGYAYGSLISKSDSSLGTSVIKLLPKDISLKDINEGKEIQNVELVVGDNKCAHFPKGSWSKSKNITLLLPENPNELPDEFKSTPLGKSIMFHIAFVNANNTEREALLKGIERQKNHIINMGNGEVSIERMEQFEGILKDFAELYKETRKDKTTPYYPQLPQKQ